MPNIEERLKNLEAEKFCFSFVKGTYMPNNKKYIKINMFDNVFYIENEQQVKEYPDIYFILKTKEVIKKHIQHIQKMTETMNVENNTRGSDHCEFLLKFDDKVYKINRNVCNDEGRKLFDEFYIEIYKLLGIDNDIKRDNLMNAIKNWKQDNSTNNFVNLIKNVINYNFYCVIKENNGAQSIATIKNSKGDTLLPAFSSKEELFKWIKVSDKEIKRLTFKNYSNILLADGNNNVGIVINPFSSNIVLDKKIVNDISKKFLN